ncbi:uncharacterized protein I303_100495 [Kwoniella dejecticola CBS 10117]|uniref:Mitochondrial carrier protein n=1 Tax=Kwoniella dejecticola CBS 10117 TaxID=1296121 RepID=A0A1A6AF74_9TREE|nr:uncharacterized protein I303_00495 [Kwoniella dejecticola CBS 10117]OBR88678.1 hypothetical protein I303_00495 [Kwoniella dejecticola CBS 10117]
MTSRPLPIDFTAPEASSSSSSSTNWRKVRHAVKVSSAIKETNKADTLAVSSTGTSASAAFARSLVLFTGFLFRRPSKLFRPSRVDTWAGLRQLAISSDQTLSASFIRDLLRRKTGLIAITLTILPPLIVNTTMGFLLFTSHSFFSLSLAKIAFFQKPKHADGELDELHDIARYHAPLTLSGARKDTSARGLSDEEEISLDTLLRGPSIIPNHPTLLSAIAGAGAGLLQGAAFTPVENVVRFLHQSTTSLTSMAAKFLHLPIRNVPQAFGASQPATPVQAIKNLFASETWRKTNSWWTGWRWAVARDALSYSCFFTAFDITRRVGLRVKALFGGSLQPGWHNVLVLDFPSSSSSEDSFSKTETDQPVPVPTKARVAQAATIVTGGVMASILAEFVGRPFRACQRIMYLDTKAQAEAAARYKGGFEPILVGGKGVGGKWEPIIKTFRERGFKPFLQPDKPPVLSTKPIEPLVHRQNRLVRMSKRVGWRLAAVGPWGFGFLVWAWVGGEI